MSLLLTSDLHLDWLAFTYLPANFNPEEGHHLLDWFYADFPAFRQLCEDPDIPTYTNRNYYDVCLQINPCLCVYYDNFKTEKGINVQVSGGGLNLLADILGFDDAKDLFELLIKKQCRISRMDIAYDDYSKTFLPYQFAEWYQNNQICTKFRKCHYIASQYKKGDTFYLGSRGSGKLLRIYDKDYESNGAIPAIRYEFEIHREYAVQWMLEYLKPGFIGFKSIIDDWLRVLKPNKNFSNHSQVETLPEWEDFAVLGFSERKIHLKSKRSDSTVLGKLKNLYRMRDSLSLARNLLPLEVFDRIVYKNSDPPDAKKFYGYTADQINDSLDEFSRFLKVSGLI